MGLRDFIASQLRKPTGFAGRQLAARYMTWANVEINRAALEALSLQADDRVLEIGPGPGDLMSKIVSRVPRGSVAGVDFSQEMVDVCAKRFAPLVESGQVEVRCANAEALPWANDQFTKACTVNTIYFWPKPVVVLGEVLRVLRPGGRLVVSFMPRGTLAKLPVSPAFALYEGDDVARLFESAGFRDVHVARGEDRRGEHLTVSGRKVAV